MPGRKNAGGKTAEPPKKRSSKREHNVKLNNELFSEAFQYFTRLEADDLRLTCRMFNEFAGQLCDVFGYKLRLSYLSVAKGTKNHTVSVKIRSTNGREISFEDDEEEAMTRLKAAVRAAMVMNCEINATVISGRLCGLFVEACSETAIFNMLLLSGVSLFDRKECEMESTALH
ncbi:hypothetical protein AAVH_36729, partial [Aphelenchoides avenae]